MEPTIRLSKLMSQRGLCSRREAESYIDLKQVVVDGKVIETQGTKVAVDAKIELLNKAKELQNNKATILLNKPLGFLSTNAEGGYPGALDLITKQNQQRYKNSKKLESTHLQKLGIAGRLDVDSTGLLVLSQDGVLVKQIIGPDSEMEKEYLVKVKGNITKEKLNLLRFGLELDGKPLKQAEVEMLSATNLRFLLKEGKNRQIRRMCKLVDLIVVELKRVRIGNVKLGDLQLGQWRFLKEEEKF